MPDGLGVRERRLQMSAADRAEQAKARLVAGKLWIYIVLYTTHLLRYSDAGGEYVA